MGVDELKPLLNSSGIPFAYHIWRKPGDLPWGVFRFESSDKFHADGIVYFQIARTVVELYTELKDPETEKQLEDTLTAAGISFSKDEEYIESEKMFKISYECEV